MASLIFRALPNHGKAHFDQTFCAAGYRDNSQEKTTSKFLYLRFGSIFPWIAGFQR